MVEERMLLVSKSQLTYLDFTHCLEKRDNQLAQHSFFATPRLENRLKGSQNSAGST